MANKIDVTFLHPTNGQDMEVEIDDTLTATAIINELIASNFIPDNSSRGGYKLLIKDTQTEIGGSQTVASGGKRRCEARSTSCQATHCRHRQS